MSLSLRRPVAQQAAHRISIAGDSIRPLESADELKYYLAQQYMFAAQFNGRSNFWINQLCAVITDESRGDVLTRISNMVSTIDGFSSCHVTTSSGAQLWPRLDRASSMAWNWQLCSELVFPMGCGNGSMLPLPPFNFTTYAARCVRQYGISPQPSWVRVHYGSKDLGLTLRKFGSNIIFSNGLRDPYSSASFVNSISKTIVAITTKEGSHCMDLEPIDPKDPKWLKKQREKEIKLMAHWANVAQKGIF